MESKIDGMVYGSTVDAGLIRLREKLMQEAFEVERKQWLNKILSFSFMILYQMLQTL
jgi:hypothetical protein